VINVLNEQGAESVAVNKKTDIASVEREKVTKRIKDLEMREQKNETTDEQHGAQYSDSQIRFDFDGFSQQPLLFEISENDEMNTFLENLDSVDDFAEPEDTYNYAEYEDEQVHEKEKRLCSIFDMDPLFGPMLKRSKNVSLFDFFALQTDEELAIVIDHELYINRASTIRLMVKAEYAIGGNEIEEVRKLLEAVCFYSIDSRYMNMAFWNLFNTVYQSINEAKAIIMVMTKKERKILQIIDEFSN